MMQNATVLIDINELSRRLSIPKGTLYNWVYLHRIPFLKAGRSLRFDPDEVIRSLSHYAMIGSAGNGRRS
jgi:excisionase family DNA binding protein